MQEETIRDFVPKYCQTVAVNEDDELFIELEDLLREYFGFSLCLSYLALAFLFSFYTDKRVFSSLAVREAFI